MTDTRTHYCSKSKPKQVPVKYDLDAKAYVQTEQCEACGSMFELYEGEP